VDETWHSLGPEFLVLAALAAANVVRTRRLSPLSTIFALSFGFAVAECVWLVPGQQLAYAWRSIVYTFPLLVVVADNAGALLARSSRGGLLLAATAALAAAHQGFQPIRDMVSVLAPGIATSPYKALGYVFRTRGLDDAARHCAAFDVPLDGPRLFYLNRVEDGVLDKPGGPSRLCMLVLAKPATPRMLRAIHHSRLVERRWVLVDGRVALDVYLNAATAQQWGPAERIDASEYSRRFTEELHNLETLFASPRWAAAPSAAWNDRFY